MSEFVESLEALRQYRRDRKAHNTQWSTDAVKAAGIAFTSPNGGAQLVIATKRGTVDFWPSTGLFKHRADGIKRRGVKNLIRFVQELQR